MKTVSGAATRRALAIAPAIPVVFATALSIALMPAGKASANPSVARLWDEQALDAIRIDKARPPVHARNLWHVSAAMYDAWSVYDTTASGYFTQEKLPGAEADREEAISFAAYRVLSNRYALSPNAATSQAAFDAQMTALGYDFTNTTLVGDSPAAVGNRVADRIIAFGLTDGSNQSNNYADTTGYNPVNAPFDTRLRGAGVVADPNRWQPLIFEGEPGQHFVTPQWGQVSTFGVERPSPGAPYGSDIVPEAPRFGSDEYKSAALEVIRFSSRLDSSLPATINLSPAVHGNNTLGTNNGVGYGANPVTGLPYADNVVPVGDYGRVLAEFWADGPHSETPPGHWNVIANQAVDRITDKRVGGSGPVVSDLEYDTKLYFALNGAIHDAAVSSWDLKRVEDYVRPITMIRHMAELGQSSDPLQAHYNPDGLPLEPGLSEVVTPESSAPGQRHEGLEVGAIAVLAWQGHPNDPNIETGGVGWIDARDWLPYQATTFATPPFPAYVSGHSTFSRAAAEILASFTGSSFFPEGLGTFVVSDLATEAGPSVPIELQWASYFDASDEAGLSRLYGGIHVRADDIFGRLLGSQIGQTDFLTALDYFNGAVPEPAGVLLGVLGIGALLGRGRRGA